MMADWRTRTGKPSALRHRGNARLNAETVSIIKLYLSEGVGARQLAKRYGVTPNTIYNIASGYAWRTVAPAQYDENGQLMKVALYPVDEVPDGSPAGAAPQLPAELAVVTIDARETLAMHERGELALTDAQLASLRAQVAAQG